MDEFLRAMLLANMAASIAIVFVLIARISMRKLFGGRAAYMLWSVVLASGLATLLPARRVVIVSMNQLNEISTTVPVVRAGGAFAEQALTNGQAVQALTSYDLAAALVSNTSMLFFAAWMLGVIITAVTLIRRQACFVKNLGHLEVDSIAGHCVWRVRHAGAGPAVIGFLRPRIILPHDFEAKFDEEERTLIIAHERLHIASGDAVVNYLVAAMLCICWFNPFIHVAAWFIHRDQEIACDSDVLAQFPKARGAYATALFKTQISTDVVPIGCAWPASSVHPLKERIEIICETMTGRLRRHFGNILAIMMALTGGVVACTTQPPILVLASTEVASSTPQLTSLNTEDSSYLDRATHYNTPGVDLEEIAALLTVVVEDRSDYAIEIIPSSTLPQPTIRRQGRRQIISGGLALRDNPCRTRFDESTSAQIPGIGRVSVKDMPKIIIRAPRVADIKVDGAVLSNIGSTRRGRFENHGCGDMRIAAATEELDVTLYGYGNVVVADMNASLKASLVGIGDMKFGDTSDAVVNLIGIGDITGENVNGSLQSLLQGTGDISLGAVGSSADLTLAGAGDFHIAEVNGQLNVRIGGSGEVRIDNIDSPIADVEISGSGPIEIERGFIDDFRIDLSGSGGVRFGGEARNVHAEFYPGAPDIFIENVGRKSIRYNGTATGRVIVNR